MRVQQSTPLLAGVFLAAAALGNQTEANATTTDYIVNGTFSDPSTTQQTGWYVGGTDTYAFYHNTYHQYSTGYAQSGGLIQNFLDVAGGANNLSFNLYTSPGAAVIVLLGFDMIGGLSSTAVPYTTFHFNNITGTGHDRITFMSFNSIGTYTSTSISDVSLVPVVPEPEPAALLLVGLGLIGWVARCKVAANA